MVTRRRLILSVDAYRPSAEEYCRGCQMDAHGEDHELRFFDDFELAASFWAEKVYLNQKRRADPSRSWEADWELCMTINGVPCWFEGDEQSTPYGEDDLEPHERAILDVFALAVKGSLAWHHERDRREAEEAAAKAARAKEADAEKARLKRKQYYETLKKEFES